MVAVMKERPMNGAEKRRVNRVLARAVALSIIRDGGQLDQLDIDLLPTNRLLERWAVGVGDGIPSDEWDDTRKSSRLPPLDDVTAIVVDQAIMRGLPRYRSLVRQWYCGTGSSTTIAERFGVTRKGLYFEWRCSLLYYRDQFRATGHQDLIALLERLD
jgi:hypothetical protein